MSLLSSLWWTVLTPSGCFQAMPCVARRICRWYYGLLARWDATFLLPYRKKKSSQYKVSDVVCREARKHFANVSVSDLQGFPYTEADSKIVSSDFDVMWCNKSSEFSCLIPCLFCCMNPPRRRSNAEVRGQLSSLTAVADLNAHRYC